MKLLYAVTRVLVTMPRISFDRIKTLIVKLQVLPVKARTELKLCLLVNEPLPSEYPKYIFERIRLTATYFYLYTLVDILYHTRILLIVDFLTIIEVHVSIYVNMRMNTDMI